MGWENHKVEHQRLQLVMAYISNEALMTDLCKRYGVSRKTGYKWYNIFCQRGKEGLKDMARVPHDPYRLYTKDQIEIAIDLKVNNTLPPPTCFKYHDKLGNATK